MTGTELAKAYIQIVPSARGMKSSLESEIGGEIAQAGEKSGKNFGGKLKGAVMKYATLATVGKVMSSSIMEGANLEQSVGGIKKIFGDDVAQTVIQNANNAFATAGVSANQYMEGVSSFSAALMQSTGNNAKKSADIADMAFKDMSDNANTYGTDMESIQNAYQGFAKQNYTMLDNLKLGYGGTKEEMQRLLADASKFSGQEYDISNLSDVYEAVHVIQGEMNVTGTTAKESATTFQGSFNTMKAAASNLMGAVALGDEAPQALTEAIGNVVSSTGQFVMNAAPMLINAAIGLIETVFKSADKIGENLGGGSVMKMMSGLVAKIGKELPRLLKMGMIAVGKFALGLVQAIPKIFNAATKLINNFSNGISSKNGDIINTAIRVIGKFAIGLIKALPQIVAAGARMVAALLNGIFKLRSTVLKNGKNLAMSLLNGIKNGISGIGSSMKSVGKDLVAGIWAGVKDKFGWLTTLLKSFAKNVKDKLKSFFGIKSPSRLMRDEVGIYLAEGIGVGFVQGMDNVVDDMAGAIPTSFNTGIETKMQGFGASMAESLPASSYVPGSPAETNITISIPVDGEVIAQKTITFINDQIRQFGASPITC